MIISAVVRTLIYAMETPAVHLAHERRILPMAEVERYDLFLECTSLMDAPCPTVWEPGDNVIKGRIRQDGMQLRDEGWLLVVVVVIVTPPVGRLLVGSASGRRKRRGRYGIDILNIFGVQV